MRQILIVTEDQYKDGYVFRNQDGRVSRHSYTIHPDAPHGGKNREGHYIVIDPRDPGILADHRHIIVPEK